MAYFLANPQIQEAINRVAEQLRRMRVGETLPYGAFAGGRYVLDRARAAVEKQDGIRFGTVHNTGVKRLAADEVPSLGTSGIRRLHRAAKKTVARLSTLRAYNDMAPGDRLRVAAQRMVAASVAEKTSRAAVKEAEDNVRTAGAAVDFGGALKKG